MGSSLQIPVVKEDEAPSASISDPAKTVLFIQRKLSGCNNKERRGGIMPPHNCTKRSQAAGERPGNVHVGQQEEEYLGTQV